MDISNEKLKLLFKGGFIFHVSESDIVLFKSIKWN